MADTTIHVTPTRYSVSVLPADSPVADQFTITVESVGDNLWEVRHQGRALSVGGEWHKDPGGFERPTRWSRWMHMDESTAMRLAREQAPLLCGYGKTAADFATTEH